MHSLITYIGHYLAARSLWHAVRSIVGPRYGYAVAALVMAVGWWSFRRHRRHNYHRYLRSRGWLKRRGEAVARAHGHCERCGSNVRLEVHHRTYARVGRERPEDLEVLCRRCHIEQSRAEGRIAA